MRVLASTRFAALLAAGVLACEFAGAATGPATLSAAPAGNAATGLACIQDALGGTAAFAKVSSLHIKAEKKPTATTGMRLLAGTREIFVVFPDRYKRVDIGHPPRGTGTLDSTVGFDRDVLLSRPGLRDEKITWQNARQDFVMQMLARLPRALPGVTLSSHLIQDSGRERLAIEASGANNLRVTLLADSRTCVPIALQYPWGAATRRINLSSYRPFGGIRFPTMLALTSDGQPQEEEHVTSVEVNAPATTAAFTKNH